MSPALACFKQNLPGFSPYCGTIPHHQRKRFTTCSAGFQPAVSPASSRQFPRDGHGCGTEQHKSGPLRGLLEIRDTADWKPAATICAGPNLLRCARHKNNVNFVVAFPLTHGMVMCMKCSDACCLKVPGTDVAGKNGHAHPASDRRATARNRSSKAGLPRRSLGEGGGEGLA
jgi:hypothetical protein